MAPPQQYWHVSKSVPIAVLVSLGVQAGAWIWYASAMQAQITINTNNIDKLERKFVTLESASNAQAVQLGRIEEGIKGINAQLSALASRLYGPKP